MKKSVMVVLLVILLLFALGLMIALTLNKPELVLSDSFRQTVSEWVGLDVLRHDTPQGRVEEKEVGVAWYEAKGVWNKPLTVFAKETVQRGDEHILSRGYGADGFERVMIRGQSLDTVRIKPYNGV